MRSTRRLFLVALAALAMLVTIASPALAQFGPVQAGGVIQATTAAVNASGSVATAQTFLTFTPATSFFTTQPVYIRSRGYLASLNTAPGTFTITVTVGAISITPVSAVTLTSAMSNQPYMLDCGVLPTASATYAKELVCEFQHRSAGADGTASTVLRFLARTTGTLAFTSPLTVTATVTFTDATLGTGLIAQHNEMVQGY